MYIQYNGPRTTEGLYADRDFINVCDGKIGMSRVTVIRPIFEEWSLVTSIEFDEEILNPEDVLAVLVVAGKRMGIGTWRQQHGRFTIEVIKPETSIDLAVPCDRLGVPLVLK